MFLIAYHVIGVIAAPVLRLWLERRARRGREIADRLGERRGIDATPRPAGRLLWVHAASVGEALSVLPVLDAFARRSAATVLMTTGTVTSATLLRERRPATLHRFVPIDVPAWGDRFLDHWRPDAAAFVESEIWPGLLGGCRRRGIGIALINGRLSDRSARGWGRAPRAARRLFGGFAFVHARSAEDARRLTELGAPAASLIGDLKTAADPLPVDPAELARWSALLGDRPRWIAASTHHGEEAVIRAVHARLVPRHPGLLTIIAPRHPQRGAEIANGAPRRALGDGPPAEGVWVADTIGELGLWYRLARRAFVGGSLVAHGGQNPLEAARLGCAVAVGPHTDNFAEAVAMLTAAGTLTRISDAETLAAWVERGFSGEVPPAAPFATADALPDRVAAALSSLVG